MLSKFKNQNPELRILKRQALTLSAGLHVALLAAILGLIFYKPSSDTIDFAVVEAPVASAQATKLPTIVKPAPKPVTPKTRAVFGVSRTALTNVTPDPESAAVKPGNTVAVAPDNKKLSADDADSLPIPTDEFLVTNMPTLLTEVRIPYPPEAKKKRIQGPVIMDLLIDATGKVREAKFVNGPGFGLNEAALDAVRQFQFSPAKIQDKTVAVRIRYAYRFILN